MLQMFQKLIKNHTFCIQKNVLKCKFPLFLEKVVDDFLEVTTGYWKQLRFISYRPFLLLILKGNGKILITSRLERSGTSSLSTYLDSSCKHIELFSLVNVYHIFSTGNPNERKHKIHQCILIQSHRLRRYFGRLGVLFELISCGCIVDRNCRGQRISTHRLFICVLFINLTALFLTGAETSHSLHFVIIL